MDGRVCDPPLRRTLDLRFPCCISNTVSLTIARASSRINIERRTLASGEVSWFIILSNGAGGNDLLKEGGRRGGAGHDSRSLSLFSLDSGSLSWFLLLWLRSRSLQDEGWRPLLFAQVMMSVVVMMIMMISNNVQYCIMFEDDRCCCLLIFPQSVVSKKP